VQFYHEKRFINRSTGCLICDDPLKEVAIARAAQIVLEICRGSAVPAALEPRPKPMTPKTDAGLEFAIQLYCEWLQSPMAPCDCHRPRERTARGYINRLRQLAGRLEVATVRELREKAVAIRMTAAALGMTEEHYVPMVRGAAGVFGRLALKYFETQGLKIHNPLLGYIPGVIRAKPFVAPSREKIAGLAAAARDELCDDHPREYLLFLLTLMAGLRVQEAAFVRWQDILPTSVRVASTSDHLNKANRTRDIPVSQKLLDELERHRASPQAYVIPDGSEPPTPARRGVPDVRCSRAARRLAKWLRAQGVAARNPIHWLRKVFGSRVTEQHDLHTASKWLGHGSITTTEQVYAGISEDKRAEVV